MPFSPHDPCKGQWDAQRTNGLSYPMGRGSDRESRNGIGRRSVMDGTAWKQLTAGTLAFSKWGTQETFALVETSLLTWQGPEGAGVP